jgi:FkbM family methyltransferase
MIRALIDKLFIKQPRVRIWVTKLIYGVRDRGITIFGTPFTVNSLSENGYVRAAAKIKGSSLLEDEVAVLISIATLLDPGDTFIDVGANIGLFCGTLSRINQLFGQLVVRFYAYEPHPETFRRLTKNTAGKDIVVRNCALSDSAGEAEFVEGAVSHVFTHASRPSPYILPRRRRKVRTVRLADEAIDGESLILKIDVEGHEFAVLEGARQLFECSRVKAVYLDGYSEKPKVEEFLRSFGFIFLNGRTSKPFEADGFSLLAINGAYLLRVKNSQIENG